MRVSLAVRAALVGLLLGLTCGGASVQAIQAAEAKRPLNYELRLSGGSWGGLGAKVSCDTNAGVLIYEMSDGRVVQFAAARSPSCKASGKAVFPYKFGTVPVDCDAAAGVVIYRFEGPYPTQFVLVPAPDVCTWID